MVEMTAKSTEQIRIRALRSDRGVSGFLLPVPGFPVPEQELLRIRPFLSRLCSAFGKNQQASNHVFVQHAALDFERGAPLLSKNAPKWMPKTGLGVWANREPPSFWKPEEFMGVEPGKRPRPLMNKVFHLTGPGAVEQARNLLFGLGSLLEIVTSGSVDGYMKSATARLRPLILEEAFQNFEFYLPLLDVASIEAIDPKRQDDVLCGALAYIRESREDQGILILSQGPLEPVFTNFGGRLEAGPEPEWRF